MIIMKPTNSLLAEEVIEEGNLMKKIAVLDVNGTIQDTGSAIFCFCYRWIQSSSCF